MNSVVAHEKYKDGCEVCCWQVWCLTASIVFLHLLDTTGGGGTGGGAQHRPQEAPRPRPTIATSCISPRILSPTRLPFRSPPQTAPRRCSRGTRMHKEPATSKP